MENALIILMLVIGLPLTIPLLAIWTHHKRKMEELAQRRQQSVNQDIRSEFAAVRAEIKALRDTTMQYDLSFDTSLQSLEHRLSQLERQSNLNSSVTPRTNLRSNVDNGITQNLYR